MHTCHSPTLLCEEGRGFSQELTLQLQLTRLTLEFSQPSPLRHRQRRLGLRILRQMPFHPIPQRLRTDTVLPGNLRQRLLIPLLEICLDELRLELRAESGPLA